MHLVHGSTSMLAKAAPITLLHVHKWMAEMKNVWLATLYPQTKSLAQNLQIS
jgi:hypothetical protein